MRPKITEQIRIFLSPKFHDCECGGSICKVTGPILNGEKLSYGKLWEVVFQTRVESKSRVSLLHIDFQIEDLGGVQFW